jgi:hypothetical protein
MERIGIKANKLLVIPAQVKLKIDETRIFLITILIWLHRLANHNMLRKA